jgi:hypothetical protein
VSDPTLKTEPYWRAPRRLARMLEDSEITATEFAIVNYIAEAGADRPDGVSTSYEGLARIFGVHTKTVSRALIHLCELEMVTYSLRRGQRTPFRIRTGDAVALRTLEGGSMSEVVSEVVSYVSKPVSEVDDHLKPASDNGKAPPSTSDTGEVVSEHTETDTETTTSIKSRGGVSSDNVLPIFENDHLVYKLMGLIAEHADAGKDGGPSTRLQVERLANQLPEAAVVKVIEQLRAKPNIANRAGYAIAALKGQLEERRAA